MEYSAMTDERLIKISREGNEEVTDYLLNKYKGLVRRKARTMFLVGGDTDDLIQEGMIGLYKAVRDFDERKDASFLTFASLCIDRQIYTAINASNRKKHSPLNGYISLPDSSVINSDNENEIYLESQATDHKNPEEIYIDNENVIYIEKTLEKELSKFEYEVLKMYIDGADYMEIARRMDKKPKSIDNALQRIRKKVNVVMRRLNQEN